ncbi:MAG: hypothetical protein AB8B85_23045 [Paracoccaceae bacterium]
MKGQMYSFRVTSPTVITLLDRLPQKSRFIRDAVTDRLLGDAAGITMEPAGQGSVDSHAAPPDELRSGLAAIAQAVTALMAESSAAMSAELRAGLDAIAQAAGRLAADRMSDPACPEPDASPDTSTQESRDGVADPDPVSALDKRGASLSLNPDKDTWS